MAGRVGQQATEALVAPSTQKARVGQQAVEVLYPSDNPVGGATPFVQVIWID